MENEDLKPLTDLLRIYNWNEKIQKVEHITGSGSNRRYVRIYGVSATYIGVSGESREENKSFVNLAKHFKSKQLSVPEVYAVSDDWMYYLQEDVGKSSLFDLIQQQDNTADHSRVQYLLTATVRLLPHFQFKGAEGLDFSLCYPVNRFDSRSIHWDLNYFKYCFLKPSNVNFSEPKLEDDFDKMTQKLLENQSDTFMYRDFQSRNVMVKNNDLYFIDFQGGRQGPIFYDLASFVWQAKAQFSEETKKRLIEDYLSELKQFVDISDEVFYSNLYQFVLFRMLQVLGAYGFRGYFERKTHFLESIPFAVKNIVELDETLSEYSQLTFIFDQLKMKYIK